MKAHEMHEKEKTGEPAVRKNSHVSRGKEDEISEAAEQRARRMQQERLRSVMSKYYTI
jgi:hypothetical protein